MEEKEPFWARRENSQHALNPNHNFSIKAGKKFRIQPLVDESRNTSKNVLILILLSVF
jgi:hypothetical protein